MDMNSYDLNLVKEKLITIKRVLQLYEFTPDKRSIAIECGLSTVEVAEILYQNGYDVDYHEICSIEEAIEY